MRFLLPLFAAALLPACHPCQERCTPRAAAYDDCMHLWGIEWADLGAEDQTDYREQCEAGQGIWTDGLDDEQSSTEGTQCSALRDDLRVATTCEQKKAAIDAYGTN